MRNRNVFLLAVLLIFSTKTAAQSLNDLTVTVNGEHFAPGSSVRVTMRFPKRDVLPSNAINPLAFYWFCYTTNNTAPTAENIYTFCYQNLLFKSESEEIPRDVSNPYTFRQTLTLPKFSPHSYFWIIVHASYYFQNTSSKQSLDFTGFASLVKDCGLVLGEKTKNCYYYTPKKKIIKPPNH
jgi:hypothetical protein